MKIRVLMVFTLIVLASNINAQELPIFKNPQTQITSSPTASSLGTYGGIDLKKSTGGVAKSIPLFELRQGAISYNPTIEYFSTGIRVNDWGGRLGIGWNENFTATIQRTVRSVPDEYTTKRLTTSVFQLVQAQAPTSANYNIIEELERDGNITNGVGNFDGEYDLFSYNIFGLSGQFMILNNQAVLLTHKENVKIDILSTYPFHKFKVTDANGFKYYFETEIEYTSMGVDEIITTSLPTAWFLNKIESPYNDVLNFNYSSVSYACKTDFYQNFTFKDGPGPGDDNICMDALYQVYGNSYGVSRKFTQTKCLTSVIGTNFKLTFDYGSREDLVGDKLLSAITLYDAQNNAVSNVNFGYNTFSATTQPEGVLFENDDYYNANFGDLKKRYFLKNITFPNTGSKSKEYSFGYIAPQDLPHRFSFSQDEGGYYNGISNTWFIPKARVKEYINGQDLTLRDFPLTFTGDRRPNHSASKAGILYQITYPTGGSDEIEYDQNSYTATVQSKQTETLSDMYHNANNEGPNVFHPDELFDWIHVDPKDTVSIDLVWDIYEPGTPYQPEDGSETHYALFRIIDGEKPYPSYRTFWDCSRGIFCDYVILPTNTTERRKTIKLINGPAGDISLECTLYGQFMRVFLDFTYCFSNQSNRVELSLPGLRVKQITTKSLTSPPMAKTYNYKRFTKQNIGSDTPSKMLVYSDATSSNIIDRGNAFVKSVSSKRFIGVECEPSSGGAGGSVMQCVNISYPTFSSNSRFDLNAFQGNPIAYDCVTEEQGGAYTASQFDVSTDLPGSIEYGDESFLNPKENTAWGNGLELYRYLGSKIGSRYDIVKEQAWNYENTISQAIENCCVYRKYEGTGYCGGQITYEPYTIISYFLRNNWYKLSSFSETQYNEYLQSPITSTTNYFYENNTHAQLTREETTDSNGNFLKKIIKYPLDINTGIYASMASLNMHNYPIEHTEFINNQASKSNLTTYKSGGGSYVPDKIYSLETTSPLSSFTFFNGSTKDIHYSNTPKVSYDIYNNTNGNLCQITSRDGITTSYLWDATGNYLMAQVKGATYSQISSLDGQVANSNSSDLKTSLNNLVPSYSQIQTYSYKPLVGLRYTTDPSGLTTQYEYDNFRRLILQKNDDGHILFRYKYNYKQ